MEELREKIDDAGITVMNEIGLDPGIDQYVFLNFVVSSWLRNY